MYFSAKDKGEMMSMIYNWPSEQVGCNSLKSAEENMAFLTSLPYYKLQITIIVLLWSYYCFTLGSKK